MSREYDVQTALDISSLTSVTQAQLMQMFSRLKPLANKGLNFISVNRPNITDNPHYIRYIWIDITNPSNPVFKRYIADRVNLVDADASWAAEVAADGSILTAMLAPASPTGGVDIAKLKRSADGLSDITKRFFIVRLDTNGQFAEVVDLNVALADINGGVNLAVLNTTGIGAAKYLGFVAGALGYRYLDPVIDFTAALNNRVPAASIKPSGGSFFVLRVNAANDACEFVDPSEIPQSLDITLDKLGDDIDGNSPTALKVPQVNEAGTKTLWTTPVFAREFGPILATTGDRIVGVAINGNPPTGAAVAIYRFAHALGATPKEATIHLVCVVNDAATGYVVNDEIDAVGIFQGGPNFRSGVSFCLDVNNLTVHLIGGDDAGLTVFNKATGVPATLTPTSWKLQVACRR